MLYWGLAWWRNFFYNIGFFITRRVSVPVVSIGNLSVGGTGKTPATIYTALHLLGLGYKVGIVSRGYGRRSTGTLLVSDQSGVLETPLAVGDEPYLVASRLPGVPVLVDEDRYRGASVMIGRFKPDLIILDDAFQHRGLARDCNIVLLDAGSPRTDYRIFPYGTLREHLGALRRADLVIWTRTNTESPAPVLKRKISKLGVTQIDSAMVISPQLVNVTTGEMVPVERLRGERLLAFCGIAQPLTFYQALIFLELEPEAVRYYPDHFIYTEHEMSYLSGLSDNNQLLMVTTEKDAVKLNRGFLDRHRIYALRVEFSLAGRDLEVFQDTLAMYLQLPHVTPPAGEA
ncbi:MAG: tetraacyldisaccharide 4'-kinase [Fidelibacterota bacterium]|nr:MAG: tetraacyldisaccharide 4'-kinase [Candidatus Neomarinimicrobiota bacterium]